MVKKDLSSLFYKDLVFANVEIKNFEELVDKLSQILEQKNYVKSSFKDAVLEREKKYPTGLRLDSTGVAIPHTDDVHVLKDAIVITKLKDPITVIEMATEDQKVEVKYVFMLLLKKEGEHIEVLQRLMDFFIDEENIKRLENENTEEGLYKLVYNFMK